MNTPDEQPLQYQVVSGTDYCAFVAEVETQCNDEGWQLHGGVAISTEHQRYSGTDETYEVTRYAQALVRHRAADEKPTE